MTYHLAVGSSHFTKKIKCILKLSSKNLQKFYYNFIHKLKLTQMCIIRNTIAFFS